MFLLQMWSSFFIFMSQDTAALALTAF